MSNDKQAALRTAYQEVCSSYHGIADFRAKLLGLLPLASAGIFLLLDPTILDSANKNIDKQNLSPVGLFGFVVTLGLFFYELRGIQRCNGLIASGKRLEGQLEIESQFALRPPPIGGFIGSTLAAQVIYPAVLAAWIFIATVFVYPQCAWLIATFVFIVGFVGSYILNLKVELPAAPDPNQRETDQ